MTPIKKRNPYLCIVFSLLSCGIYGLYWYYQIFKNLEQHGMRGMCGYVGQFVLSLFFLFPCLLIFGLKFNDQLNAVRQRYGLPPEDNSTMFLLLAILCPAALFAVTQHKLNRFAQV